MLFDNDDLPKVNYYGCVPPSDDAVFIACLLVHARRQKGIESALLQATLEGLRGRCLMSAEPLARKSSAGNPTGAMRFRLKHDFSVLREDADFALRPLGLRAGRKPPACPVQRR